jgi:chemotaxis protein histidine kinase CheA
MEEAPVDLREMHLFRNVQCDLGTNNRPKGIIEKLRDAVVLYVVLRGKNMDRIPVNKQVCDLVEDRKQVNKLRKSRQGKYKIRELPSNDDANVKKKYAYMVKHWFELSREDSSLKMTGKNIMSYTTFLQHQTRFKKIWFHTSLFIFEKCISVEELCEEYKKFKKISDIEYEIRAATGHHNFVSKTLTFIFYDDDEEEEEEAKRKAEEEAKRKAEEEAKRKAEETKRKEEEKAKSKEEEKAKSKEEEKAKRKAEEEAKSKAEEKAKRKEEEKAKSKEEEKAKSKEEEKAKRKEEEKAKSKEEEKAKSKEEEEEEKEPASSDDAHLLVSMQKTPFSIGRHKRKRYNFTEHLIGCQINQRLCIDLTQSDDDDDDYESRAKKIKTQHETPWLNTQYQVMKRLFSLKVVVEFAAEMGEIESKPSPYTDLLDELENKDLEKELAYGDKKDEKKRNVRCWRLIVILKLSQYQPCRRELRQMVLALHEPNFFAPSGFMQASEDAVKTIMKEYLPSFVFDHSSEKIEDNPQDLIYCKR